jgi:hypothetical protein
MVIADEEQRSLRGEIEARRLELLSVNERHAGEPNPTAAIFADLIARCPEHGNRTETLTECRCDAARAGAAAMAETDPEVVAYQSYGGRMLRCLNHKPENMDGFVPVAADDLEDGGVCTFPDCGADVLITEGN